MKNTMKKYSINRFVDWSIVKRTLAVAGMTMGLAFGAQAEPCNDCITFSSKGAFKVQLKKGTGLAGVYPPTVNIEYSTDKTNWAPYDPTQAYEAAQSGGAGDYVLYWRGTNNTQFAAGVANAKANYFTITTNGADLVVCSGNIETLLDYKEVAAKKHPQMGDYAFYSLFVDCKGVVPTIQLPATNLTQGCYGGMFWGCTSLTTAPELPATTMQEKCYKNMFSGCTSLTAAPKLPATNLTEFCYDYMFSDCTSLTAAPELPAMNLAQGCYSGMFEDCTSLTAIPTLDVSVVAKSCCLSMFQGCTNLVVNTEGPGKAWSIPADVEIPDDAKPAANKYWAKDMFKSTAGSITNSTEVTPGTTYCVASAPVTLDVAAVEGATFAVTTNDAPATVPCTINYIIPVTVTYTAKPGYAFPSGKAAFTTNVTASAETVTVTLPKDQQPKPLPPVEIDVKAPDHATVAVYSNEVAAANFVPADGTVLSNSIAYVVYTVSEEGKYFENGATAVTNTLDTTTDPATDRSAYVPKSTGTSTVQLGVVAQRYPWNGTLDVEYKTPFANASRKVTFYANGIELGTAKGTGGQSATASFDLNTAADGAFKDKALKSVKITAAIEK